MPHHSVTDDRFAEGFNQQNGIFVNVDIPLDLINGIHNYVTRVAVTRTASGMDVMFLVTREEA